MNERTPRKRPKPYITKWLRQISRLEEAGLVRVEKRVRKKKMWTTISLGPRVVDRHGQNDLLAVDEVKG
jgi:hypothetical protein